MRRGAGEACQRVVELKDGRKGDRGESENRVTEGSRPCDPGFHGHRDGNPVGEGGDCSPRGTFSLCVHP